MVVGRADEDVSERVEGEGPDVGVVGLGERRAWEEGGLEQGGFGAGDVPVEYGTFGAAGDEDRVNGVPGDGCGEEQVSVGGCAGRGVLGDGRTADFFLVSFEDAELFHGADVKDTHGLVARGAGDEVAVRGPSKGLDRVFMLVTAVTRSEGVFFFNVEQKERLTALREPRQCGDPKT